MYENIIKFFDEKYIWKKGLELRANNRLIGS
jgi:hypothetical protein